MIAGGRYCSGDDAMRVFAAGNADALTVEVTWPGGRQSVLRDVKPNSLVEVDQAGAQPRRADPKPPEAPPPLFTDVSAKLGRTHFSEAFDDFARQPLLPHKLSTGGPGVVWADMDGDGRDDLIVGGGKAGRTVVFRNDAHGGFTEQADAPLPKNNPRAQTGLAAWHEAEGGLRLLTGISNWEDGATNATAAQVFDLRTRTTVNLPGFGAVAGPVALADVDGDGDLDLFVGGRAIAGRWPEAAPSRLYRNGGGTFAPMQEFPALGLVNSVVFTDVNGDGRSDLVLACEWGPVRVFRYEGGRLTEVTEQLGLSKLTGWWTGVAAGDFDGDGRMDIVAGNWGRNDGLAERGATGAELWSGDFAGDGHIVPLLAATDLASGQMMALRERKAVAEALPWVAVAFPTHRAYGRASAEALLGRHAAQARRLKATTLETTLFLNRGDRFEAHPLPVAAQMAPAFGVCVADFDGDGAE